MQPLTLWNVRYIISSIVLPVYVYFTCFGTMYRNRGSEKIKIQNCLLFNKFRRCVKAGRVAVRLVLFRGRPNINLGAKVS